MSGPERHLVLGVVATNRSTELQRLLASLAPVAEDPCVHVIVLDNSTLSGFRREQETEVERTLCAESGRCAGMRQTVRAAVGGSPLHLARRELSLWIASCLDTQIADAAVWMLDDDLTFEELSLVNGRVRCSPVARERVAAARMLLRAHPDVDVFVSGFTGDPPIRPEAVLASQLTDLGAALRTARALSPGADWPSPHASDRTCDDYYDHSEVWSLDELLVPRQWIPREHAGTGAETERRRMLEAACTIPRGCTPFRPLLAPSPRPIRPVDRANGGGNILFRSAQVLRLHPYPASPIASGYTRRADMIGLNWLARHANVRLAEAQLTLRHNRCLQPLVEPNPERWTPEFAGVLLSRSFDASAYTSIDRAWIRELASRRCNRILAGLASAEQAARTVALEAGTIRFPGHSIDDTRLLGAIVHMAEHVRCCAARLLDGRLASVLSDPGLVEVALSGLLALNGRAAA